MSFRAAAALMLGAQALTAQTPVPPVLGPVGTSWSFMSAGMALRAEVMVSDIETPWGLTFLPDGRALATDRGRAALLLVDPRRHTRVRLANTPRTDSREDGGLLDVALHPAFATNGCIYLSYSEGDSTGAVTVVERAHIRNDSLVDRTRLYVAQPAVARSTQHGGRLVLRDSTLFIALGERGQRDLAQDLRSSLGKIIRLRDDGRVPSDNPFAGRIASRSESRYDASAEIWSLGHRNPQGLAINPTNGQLWETEHGPRGGDEINIIAPSKNYGWPVITYGREYAGPLINSGLDAKDGLEQPLHYWVPSIAPSGLAFYMSDRMPAWRGSTFVGALAKQHLNRTEIRDGRVVVEERLFTDKHWRVRVVVPAPDGSLWFGVDGGMLLRITPDPRRPA
jgi:glucose/arabinose dehydrogenase